jgi:multisubunit Na+/H+ antiporter MnhE subunit
LSATAAGQTQINLSWSSVSGAASYNVYRSTTSGGPYSVVANTTSTSYSNTGVARRILGPQSALTPAFIWVPLDIRSAHGITALASIITLTPGTVSAELTRDQRHLLVHCFNLADANKAIATIKARYEAPLMEIFR